MGQSVRSGDPEAMGELALLLDDVAGRLDVERNVTRAAVAAVGAPPPSLAALTQTANWLRNQANDLRRRALDLLSADRTWRHGSFFDHVGAVAHAALGGVAQGVAGIGSGGMAAGRLVVDTQVEPGRLASTAVDRGISGAAGEVRRDVNHRLGLGLLVGGNVVALTPQVRVEAYAHELRDDGTWATAEDVSRDTSQQLPGALLTVAGFGAGAVAEGTTTMRALAALRQGASDVSYASMLAPGASGQTRAHGDALLLSVPGDDGRRVGLDPADGRFVVFRPADRGFTEQKTRWSGLGEDDRESLQRSGIVDRRGHLRDPDWPTG
jgi:hypothetical protein